MSEAEWHPQRDQVTVAGKEWDGPFCPGGYTRQPFMAKAATACRALRKGSLDVVYPEIEAALADAAVEVDAAWDRFEQWELNEVKKQHRSQ